MSDSTNQKETDLLKYESNTVPRILRFVWTLMFIFFAYYLAVYSWPDLKEWLAKLK